MPSRELDWEHADRMRERRLMVPLAGLPDPAWADEFDVPRKHIAARRRARSLPRVEIVMDKSEVKVDDIPPDEALQVEEELQEIVEVTNSLITESDR